MSINPSKQFIEKRHISTRIKCKKCGKLNYDKWTQEMIVTSSTSYNVVLGNDWISKVKGIINYKERNFTYDYENETNQIPISCWKKFRNPNQLYEIEFFKENELKELELEE